MIAPCLIPPSPQPGAEHRAGLGQFFGKGMEKDALTW